MAYNSIRPGQLWLDTDGKPIQAHGFSVFYNEQEKLYYWYGENKEKSVGGKNNTIWHWGVRLYTSPDLYNWTDKGLIIPPEPEDLDSPLHPTYCMDRPHIIYCPKTGKYVAWLKIMAGEVSQFMCIMTADRFEGPYTYARKIYKPLHMDSGDFALYSDPETGKGYIWFERPHFQLVCATLSDDYTAVEGKYSIHFDGLLPPLTREAPTFFERNGKKYLFTSGTSGYYPNPSRVFMFDDCHGQYTDLGDPCVGDKSGTTFNSQITSVIRLPGTDQYIACADRWMPDWWVPKMSKQIISGMKRHFKDYKPDLEPKKAAPLPGVEQKHGENTSKSRYVWLPIKWDGDKPTIRWRDEWRVEDLIPSICSDEALKKPFMIGAATAAHQVEGNNVHSDCWVMENLPHSDYAEPSGAAVDHYNRYEEDIRLLKDAGGNAYRFSIEWARIETEEGKFDRAEIEHYRKVLEYCRSLGITPIVTLHHFSSPAWLISKGGWGRRSAAEAFQRYAAYVARELGSLMPYVCTINEANMGYQLKKIAADMMKSSQREGDVQVGVNLDLKVIIKSMFEKGKAFHCSPLGVNNFLMPRSKKQEEIVMEAHRLAREAIRAASPATKVGLTLSLFDYQPTAGGHAQAVQLWEDDYGFYLPYIRGDDFLGVQNYSRKIVDARGAREPEPGRPVTQMGYEDYPASIGNVLRKVAETYKGELIVTENGIATGDDARRCAFIREAVASVLSARADGVPVTGYLHWSLLDNFEWQAGYEKTFGLIAVEREAQTRHPKESLAVLGSLKKEFSQQ